MARKKQKRRQPYKRGGSRRTLKSNGVKLAHGAVGLAIGIQGLKVLANYT